MSDKNFSPYFEKGLKGDDQNVFNSNECLAWSYDISFESSAYKKNYDA